MPPIPLVQPPSCLPTTFVENAPAKGVDFIASAFGSTALVSIKPDTGPVLGCCLDSNDPSAAARWAEQQNVAGSNLYFAANLPVAGLAKKPLKADIHVIRCVFADVYDKGGPTIAQALRAIL